MLVIVKWYILPLDSNLIVNSLLWFLRLYILLSVCVCMCVWSETVCVWSECVCIRSVLDSHNENKIVVIISFPQNDPSIQKNNMLWSFTTQALHHSYYPAAAIDWCVFSLLPESYPLILHLPLQHNCTEATARIVRVHTMDFNLSITQTTVEDMRRSKKKKKIQNFRIKKCFCPF